MMQLTQQKIWKSRNKIKKEIRKLKSGHDKLLVSRVKEILKIFDVYKEIST